MKEFDGQHPDLKKQEIISKKQVESKLLGVDRRPSKNHKLFQMNPSTYVMLEVELKEVANVSMQNQFKSKNILADSKREPKHTHEVKINDGWPTVWALNQKIALKKFMNQKFRV